MEYLLRERRWPPTAGDHRIQKSSQAANTALISAATCGPFSFRTKWPASSHTSFASGRSLR
jgi:hypothetical protein